MRKQTKVIKQNESRCTPSLRLMDVLWSFHPSLPSLSAIISMPMPASYFHFDGVILDRDNWPDLNSVSPRPQFGLPSASVRPSFPFFFSLSPFLSARSKWVSRIPPMFFSRYLNAAFPPLSLGELSWETGTVSPHSHWRIGAERGGTTSAIFWPRRSVCRRLNSTLSRSVLRCSAVPLLLSNALVAVASSLQVPSAVECVPF